MATTSEPGDRAGASCAFMPGRFSPPHQGHIQTFLWLLSRFDRLIIGIGSCYEVGRPRHPLLAFLRQKMILWSLVQQGANPSRLSFVHLQDFDSWDEWWTHITSIPQTRDVTHFVTGNEEDILGEIRKRDIPLPFSLVNPLEEAPPQYRFPYHAADLRRAIADGDYALFTTIAAYGTVALMGHVGGFNGIRAALSDTATKFVPGRQAVDLIVTCRSPRGERMVLCGYRSPSKVDFPGRLALPGGGIDTYENPVHAAIRELHEETGFQVRLMNAYLEPLHVWVQGIITQMSFVGLFSTEDESLGGSRGGSSQVFHIDIDAATEHLDDDLESTSDLERVGFRPVTDVLREGLAFQQNDMLRQAL